MEPIIEAKRIVLHVGAHRTGTGSFQSFLSKNEERLRDHGISARFPGRDIEGDGNLKLKLPQAEDIRDNGVQDGDISKARKQLMKGVTTGELIICEENLLGRMLPFFNGKVYHRLVPRMAVMKQVLGRQPDQVVLVVRNYGEFFVSAYAQMAQVRVMPKWEDALPKLTNGKRSWVDVAAALHKGLNPTRVSVVPYANRGTDEALLAKMTKTKVAGLEAADAGTNSSATIEAITELQARLAAKEKLTWPQIRQIKADHSAAKGGTTFSPLSVAQKSAFTRKYNADLKIMQEDVRIEYMA